jgi:hypothetical protein
LINIIESTNERTIDYAGLGVDGGSFESDLIGLIVFLSAVAALIFGAWWQRRKDM